MRKLGSDSVETLAKVKRRKEQEGTKSIQVNQLAKLLAEHHGKENGYIESLSVIFQGEGVEIPIGKGGILTIHYDVY
jgi:hypothetical protein